MPRFTIEEHEKRMRAILDQSAQGQINPKAKALQALVNRARAGTRQPKEVQGA